MRFNSIILPSIVVFLTSCSGSDAKKLINISASLPASFNFNQMDLKGINSSINPKRATMSTLYGNNPALSVMKSGSPHQDGEVLALVTWKQQEDEHWFGARIPGALLSVDLIKTVPDHHKGDPKIVYQRYEGSNLTLTTDTAGRAKNIRYMLSQKPSILP